MTKFTEQAAYRVEIVSQDLQFLRNEWDQSIKEESLRRSSNVLRNLLVEDQFGKAWRSLGLERQPIIVAPDLEPLIRDIDHQHIIFAQAGGAVYQGIRTWSLLNLNYSPPPERSHRPRNLMKDFTLSSLLASVCIVFQGSSLNRRELIQYVANKLGGVHIDLTRDENKDLDRRFKAMDYTLQGATVLDLRPVYFEILSIGQCVAKAPDTERFLAIAANAVGA